jgi:hypothetical protein
MIIINNFFLKVTYYLGINSRIMDIFFRLGIYSTVLRGSDYPVLYSICSSIGTVVHISYTVHFIFPKFDRFVKKIRHCTLIQIVLLKNNYVYRE